MDIESLNRLLMEFRLRRPGTPEWFDAEGELTKALQRYLVDNLIDDWMLRQGSYRASNELASDICGTLMEKWRTGELSYFTDTYLRTALGNQLGVLRQGARLPADMVDKRVQTPLSQEIHEEEKQRGKEELDRQREKDEAIYKKVRSKLNPDEQKLFDAWIEHYGEWGWQGRFARSHGKSNAWVANHLNCIRPIITEEGENPEVFVGRLHLYKILTQPAAPDPVSVDVTYMRVMDKLDKDNRGLFNAWIRYYHDPGWQTRVASETRKDSAWVRENLDTIRQVIRDEGEANPDNFVEILHGIHPFVGQPNARRLDYATQTARLNAQFQNCPAVLELIRAYGDEGPNQVSPNDVDKIHDAYKEIVERFWATDAAQRFYQRLLDRRDNLARAIQTVGQQRDPNWLIQANLIVTLANGGVAFNDLGPRLNGIHDGDIADLLLECRDLVNEYTRHTRAG